MPAMSRRLGMSRYGRPPPLLKSLNRQETYGQSSILSGNASLELATSIDEQSYEISNQDESFILAEPLSEEDKEEEEEAASGHISHSSDDEEIGRGDIKPTIFEAKGSIRSQPTRNTTDDDGFGPIRDNALAGCNISQTESPLRRPRRSCREFGNSTPKKPRLETSTIYKAKELDIFNMTFSKSRKRPFKTYGSQSKSQESRDSRSNGESSPEAVFKYPQKVELDIPASPDKRFKIPDRVVSEEPEMEIGKIFKTFDLPACSLDSSPNKKSQFRPGPDLSELTAPEYNAPIFKTPDVLEILKDNGSMAKDVTERVQFRALENGEDAPSQPRIFRMPSITPDIGANSQSEPGEANGLEDSSFEIPLSPEISPSAACPMCGEPVNATFLNDYSGGKRMNIRTQTKFCTAHKKKSARNEWAEKGYPTIGWSDFDTRLAQHHSYLKSLLDGASSYFRNILAEQVRSGKDRTLLQAVSNSENILSPGYYGSRGFRAMSENIIDKFSSQLRRIAVTDRLVAARGVTGYVQNVLVPELAVRLICEDMGLGVEEARQVMRESVGLGDLLNEEVEDVVTWKEGDETL